MNGANNGLCTPATKLFFQTQTRDGALLCLQSVVIRNTLCAVLVCVCVVFVVHSDY